MVTHMHKPKIPSNHDPIGRSSGATAAPQSGRVRFDARGNAVWEWQTETGKFSTEINTQRLRKLEAPELSIEQTNRVKKPEGLSLSDDAMPGGGFNPYDNSPSRTKAPDPYQVRYAKAMTPAKTSTAPERKPIKDLKAYGQWLAMKKRIAENKKDE